MKERDAALLVQWGCRQPARQTDNQPASEANLSSSAECLVVPLLLSTFTISVRRGLEAMRCAVAYAHTSVTPPSVVHSLSLSLAAAAALSSVSGKGYS